VRRITRLSVILALLLLVVGSAVASAVGVFGRGQMGSDGLGRGFSGLVDRLDLTVEQQHELLMIRREYAPQILDLRLELQQKMLELQQLWNADELDEEAIAQKAGEVAALRVRLTKAEEALAEKEKQVLTPQQLEKLEQPTKSPTRRSDSGGSAAEGTLRDDESVRRELKRRELERGIRIQGIPDLRDLIDRLHDRFGIDFDGPNGGRLRLWFGLGHRI
jgi:Spy/CpxP family protein refolding chaperone